ncbi:MAG TPA: hypothetical protein VE175_15655, partial [Woeseiaceae bacterium]|nr:hypothetical protein [Woeseiaceae bacterium]
MSHTRIRHHPPAIRSGLLERPDLLKNLHSELSAKLTLVAAPAGFGKTTVLVQWRAELLRRGVAVPWLSVGPADRNPIVFLQDVFDSIRLTCPSFGSRTARRLESAGGADANRILDDLVDDLAAFGKPVVLFLDDYHSAASAETDAVLEVVISLSPDAFQLVIASRARPALGLARLRVRGVLHEVTPASLRFSLSEARAFFADVRGLTLSEEQVVRVHEHSEGWVAGLQLASLALRDPHRRDGFIASFSGRLQDIADYLAGDVLDQLPKPVQEFLLRTSVAGRLNAELAAHLTGLDDANHLLDRLEKDGLFLTPLNPEHTWYRYHQLFQEFLLGELRRRCPGEPAALYQKASEWFEARGLAGEAVEYALLAGDIAGVVKLVEQQAWLELMAGRMPRVITWIGCIPEATRNRNPKLLYLLCTALYHSNQVDEAERVLVRLAALADGRAGSAGTGQVARLQEQVRLLASGVAVARDDLYGALEPLSGRFEHLNEFECGIAANIRGYALAELGRLDEATRSLRAARRHHELAGSEFGVIYSDCFLALTDYARGNLEHCFGRFPGDESVSRVSEEKYVAPVPEIVCGVVLYQWNRLDDAL